MPLGSHWYPKESKRWSELAIDPKILKRTENDKTKIFPRDAPGYAGHLKRNLENINALQDTL